MQPWVSGALTIVQVEAHFHGNTRLGVLHPEWYLIYSEVYCSREELLLKLHLAHLET